MVLFKCNQVSLNDTSGKIEEIITISIHFRLQTKRNQKKKKKRNKTIFISLSFQRLINELDQKLRANIEQVINTGKRLYTIDNKDNSSSVESAGKFEI